METKTLEKFTLFDGMTDEELEQSAALFETIKRLGGERVTKENDFGYSLFLVVEGRLKVERDGQDIAEIEAGDVFGEVSLVTGRPRNATVTALETCELAKIMVWDFTELTERHGELARRIAAIAAERTDD